MNLDPIKPASRLCSFAKIVLHGCQARLLIGANVTCQEQFAHQQTCLCYRWTDAWTRRIIVKNQQIGLRGVHL